MKKKLLFLLLLLLSPLFVKAETIPSTIVSTPTINNPKTTSQEVKVLVIVIDPILKTVTDKSLYPNNGGHPRVSEWLSYSTDKQINSMLADFKESSHGYFKPTIVKKEYMNEFPRYTFQVKLSNGKKSYSYDEETYIEMGKTDSTKKKGDRSLTNHPLFKQGGDEACAADYNYIIKKFDLVNRKNKKEFDQVWIFSIPPTGLCEAVLIGNNAFFLNAEPVIKDCDNFAVYGWEISRPDSMFHSVGHASEQIMGRAYGKSKYYEEYNLEFYNWWEDIYKKDLYNINTKADYNKLNYWEKFSLTSYNNRGTLTGVGNTHYTYNSSDAYSYSESTYVMSNWREWLNYPNVPGDKFEKVNSSTYFNNEINKNYPRVDNYNADDRLYQRFYFSLFPHITGYTSDGHLNNWWKYMYSFDYVDKIYNNYGSTTITTTKGKQIEADYVLYYKSGKADRLKTINQGNNIYISNSNVLEYKNGKLYARSNGTSNVKISYDGKSITYKVVVQDDKPKEVLATEIRLSDSTFKLSVGSSATIKATILPSNVTNKSVTWKSSDTKVATVSNGIIKGIKEGKATITATTSNGKKATVAVTVSKSKTTPRNNKIYPTGLNIPINGLELYEGEETDFQVDIIPSNATETVLTFEIMDESIATVDDKGIVHALKAGITNLKITTVNDISRTIYISVNGTSDRVEWTSLRVISNNVTVNSGETYDLNDIIVNNDNIQILEWQSDNTSIVTIENGVISGVNEGTANVSIVSDSGTAFITVSVTKKESNDVTEEITTTEEVNKLNISKLLLFIIPSIIVVVVVIYLLFKKKR